MRYVADWALNVAALRGASYADVRVIAQRSRALTTKNGKVGSASDAESVGMNVRVIADGAWGFAASADMGALRSRRLQRRPLPSPARQQK
jgi:TldD protein